MQGRSRGAESLGKRGFQQKSGDRRKRHEEEPEKASGKAPARCGTAALPEPFVCGPGSLKDVPLKRGGKSESSSENMGKIIKITIII